MLMLSGRRPFHSSIFWRATHVLCTLLVFSYILFDVLDLDGSDFPLKRHPLERSVIVAEVAKDTKDAYSVERPELWIDLSMLFPAMSEESVPLQFTRVLRFSPLDSARTRGYRVALPRSSPTDSFQAL